MELRSVERSSTAYLSLDMSRMGALVFGVPLVLMVLCVLAYIVCYLRIDDNCYYYSFHHYPSFSVIIRYHLLLFQFSIRSFRDVKGKNRKIYTRFRKIWLGSIRNKNFPLFSIIFRYQPLLFLLIKIN